MAMAVPCCHPFYGTACAVGLTWRPLTGSLFLSSFWCRLKPGPSGKRGRKSSLLQDMLDTGRPTCTTGGRSSRELTGNDPRTDRSRSTHKDGRPEPVDGRAQAWTRLALRLVHRNVCETIGHDQPTRMGDRFWQESPTVCCGIDVLLGTQSVLFACRSLRLSFCPVRTLLRLPGPWGGRLGAHRVSSRMRGTRCSLPGRR